jgi:hypothetical protein
VIDLVASREKALTTVDAIIAKVDAPGPDYLQYFQAEDSYRAAFERLMKLKITPSSAPTNPPPVARSVWRYRRNSAGQFLIEWLRDWDGKADPDALVTGSVSFDGSVYEQFAPAKGKALQVYLVASQRLPPVAEVIGLGGVFDALAESPPSDYSNLLLSDLLRRGLDSYGLSGPREVADPESGPCLEFVFRESLEKRFPAAKVPIIAETVLLLDVAHGLAPAKLRVEVLRKEGDRYRETDAGGV